MEDIKSTANKETGKAVECPTIEAYDDSLKYWSNSCGELHYHGEKMLEYEELPAELQRLYDEVWSDSTGSYCYLAEYEGRYGIALINEYYENDFRDIFNVSPDDGSKVVRFIADELARIDTLTGCTVIVCTDECTCVSHNSYEIAVFMEADVTKDAFDKVAEFLYKNAYRKDSEWSDRLNAYMKGTGNPAD